MRPNNNILPVSPTTSPLSAPHARSAGSFQPDDRIPSRIHVTSDNVSTGLGSSARTTLGSPGPSAACVRPVSPVAEAQDNKGAKLSQVSWDRLNSERRVGFLIPTDNATVGLQLKQRTYESTDPVIGNDVDRNATSIRIADNGANPNWTECSGVVELALRPDLGLTLPGVAGLDVGFGVESLLQYRSLRPYPRSASTSSGSGPISPEIELPTTVDEALRLPRGAEIELRGRGTVKGSLGASAGPSVSAGPVSAGASVSAGVTQKYSGELRLRVKRLEKDCVRVDIADIDEASTNISAQIKAGFSLESSMTNLGQGVLISAVRSGATEDLAKVVDIVKNANLKAQISYESGTQDREIQAIVLDLSNPKAREIYGDLLGLDSTRAEELAHQENSGVFVASAVDTENNETFNANVSFFGSKLILYNALQRARQGNFQDADGKKLVYYDASYDQLFTNIVTGSSHIKWQAVSLENPAEGGSAHPYFRMKFSANDKVTYQEEVDSVFRFAKALGIDTSSGDSELESHSTAERIWESGDDTDVDIDIYFTPAGIEEIDNASTSVVVTAALTALQDLEPACANLPFGDPSLGRYSCEAVADYVKITNNRSFWSFFSDDKATKIAQDYWEKTGRDIEVDADAFSRALALGRYMKGLDATKGSKKLTKFFSALGESKGFDYRLAIATLANLAGQDDTLIHRLSIKGKEVSFEAQDEGSLEEVTPQRMMRRVRTTVA